MQTKSSRLLNEDDEEMNDEIHHDQISAPETALSASSPLRNITNVFDSNCNTISSPMLSTCATSTPIKGDMCIKSSPVSPRSNNNDDVPLMRSPVTPKCNSRTHGVSSPATPKCNGTSNGISSPVTPSYNMKLLTSIAANLEYVKDKEKQVDLMQEDSILSESSVFVIESAFNPHQSSLSLTDISTLEGEPTAKRCRREKSITVICERFVQQFPEYVEDGKGISSSITKIAANLGVEKRRIYDIVNILESVLLVKKTGKDVFEWCGRNKLFSALIYLKSMAIENGVSEILKSVIKKYKGDKFSSFVRECAEKNIPFPRFLSTKEKSLSSLTQRFLSLFLIEDEPLSIPLEIAAFIIVGDTGDYSSMATHKKDTEFKTKIRRLYDVANVLVSLKILKRNEKMHRKPTFQYIGPDLGNLNLADIPKDTDNLRGCMNDRYFESLKVLPINKDIRRKMDDGSSKEGYFEDLKLLPTKRANNTPDTSFFRTKSENWDKSMQKRRKGTSFVRHSSLQEICAVASAERSRLNSPNFLNENSNDSCMSFFSFSSLETNNSMENLCDFATKERKYPTFFDQKPISPIKCLPIHDNEEKTKELDKVSTDDGELILEQKEDFIKSQEGQKIIKLSSDQQKLVLETLKLSFEKTQVALLLTPEEKKQDSTKELENNKQLVLSEDTSHFLSPIPKRFYTENKDCEKQPMTVKEFNVFKNISNTVIHRSLAPSPKCDIVNIAFNNYSENCPNLLAKNNTLMDRKCMESSNFIWKTNSPTKSISSSGKCKNSIVKNQTHVSKNGKLVKNKNVITALPISLFSNHSSIKPSANFNALKSSQPTVVKVNGVSSIPLNKRDTTVLTVIPHLSQNNRPSMVAALPTTKNSYAVPIKLIYRDDEQKK